MIPKIPSLIGFGLLTTSFLTTVSVIGHNDHRYKQKMEEYEKLRKEFYHKNLYDKTNGMCEFISKEQCLNNDKEYLPSPNEDDLWELLYLSLESNREIDRKQKIIDGEKEKNFLRLKISRI